MRKRFEVIRLAITPSMVVGVIVALIVVTAGVTSIVLTTRARHLSEARTALYNCQGIEGIKAGDRRTIQRSLERLPSLEYYKTRPEELARAIHDTKAEIRARAPHDCYRLPIVRDSGLKRPPPRK